MTSALNAKYWCGCIPTRIGIATATALYPNPFLWGTYAAASITGNAVQLYRYDENQKGAFGQKTWWNASRYVNIVLMVIIIILAATKPDKMWMAQVASIIFGVTYRTIYQMTS